MYLKFDNIIITNNINLEYKISTVKYGINDREVKNIVEQLKIKNLKLIKGVNQLKENNNLKDNKDKYDCLYP